MAEPVNDPLEFPEANSKLTAPGDHPDCVDLLTFKGTDQRGQPVIISKFKLTWRERWAALRHGVGYLWVNARQTHPPIALSFERSPFDSPDAE